MHRVVSVKPLENFQLSLTFEDASHGIVDLSHLAGRGVFALWNEPGGFESVEIGTSGELLWGDSADLCADALHQRLIHPSEITGMAVGT